MKNSFLYVISFVLMSCAANPPKTGETGAVSLPSKYSCLSIPSGVYIVGSVLRTIDGSQADGNDVDELTVSYPPSTMADIRGSWPDIEEVVKRGADARMVTDQFRKLGLTGEASLGASYTITANAKGNIHMVASDKILYNTLAKFQDGNLVADNRLNYYFIKETIISDSITYTAESIAGIDLAASVEATDFDLSVDFNLLDSAGKVVGKNKKLVACIVIEKLDLAINKGFLGEPSKVSVNGREVVTSRKVIDNLESVFSTNTVR